MAIHSKSIQGKQGESMSLLMLHYAAVVQMGSKKEKKKHIDTQ